MGLRKRKSESETKPRGAAQFSPERGTDYSLSAPAYPPGGARCELYRRLRESVPLIDAAVYKLVRLTGGFHVECESPQSQKTVDRFSRGVPAGGNQTGLFAFVSGFFEELLTCGTAVGEILTDGDGVPCALMLAEPGSFELKRARDGFSVDVYSVNGALPEKVRHPELCLPCVLNPEPGAVYGSPLLKGMPFVSSVLMKIYESIGMNWERAGNIRFAVTYNPGSDPADRAYAAERAKQMAEEWSKAMRPGEVRDFVCAGDVTVKVIGADSAIPDSAVPVRQMLEQIVAKTGLPPFMLGLSWSSTERMSQQQADVLTSELEAYRRVLTPVIEKICRLLLRRSGLDDRLTVVWDDITMQDEVALSQADLNRAKAEKIRRDMSID